MSERQNGTVKWFNDAKGFGFIYPRERPGFVCPFPRHPGWCSKTLQEGQRVSYVAIQGQKGLQADQVQLI